MRKHISWYIRGMNGAGKFRDEINHSGEVRKTLDMIQAFFDTAESEEPSPEEYES